MNIITGKALEMISISQNKRLFRWEEGVKRVGIDINPALYQYGDIPSANRILFQS
jgi:hypothetical protein